MALFDEAVKSVNAEDARKEILADKDPQYAEASHERLSMRTFALPKGKRRLAQLNQQDPDPANVASAMGVFF